MGLLARWRSRSTTGFSPGHDPERLARDRIWNREVARLGQNEVVRRLGALSEYRSGRTGPSGFEGWYRQLDRDIMTLAFDLSHSED